MSAVIAAIAELAKVSGGDEIPSPAAQNEFLGYLNRLHVSDPASYYELMKGVCNEMKEGASICNIGTKDEENGTRNVALPQEIRPNACFVIKTCTTATNPVGTNNMIVSKKGGVEGVYINVACSKAVSAPELPNGKQPTTMEELLSAHRTSGVQIQIPLLVGPMRTIDKPHERAIDMLVHTVVAEAAMKDYKFKMHIVELGLQWVENQTGLKLLREWEDILNGRIYIGGQGKDGVIPLPYPLPSCSEGMRERSNDEMKSRKNVSQKNAFDGGGVVSSMSNPMDLLSAMRQQQQKSDDDTRVKSEEMMFTTEGRVRSSDRRDHGKNDNYSPLIMKQLVRNNNNDEEENVVVKKKPLITEVVKKPNSPPSSCMKKGFLINKTTKKEQLLYPEGGSNEHDPNAYSKLMSIYKVIDTGKISEFQKGKKEVEPPPTAAVEHYGANVYSHLPSKQHENTNKRREDVEISHTQMKGRVNVELDSLLSIADPGTEMEENEGTEEDFIGEQLSTLANLLCGSTSMMTTSLHEQPPCEGDNHKNEVNTAFIQQQHEQQPVEQVQQEEQPEYQKQQHVERRRLLPPGVQQRGELLLIDEQQKEQQQPQDEDHQPTRTNYSLTTKDTEAYLYISNLPVEALDNPKAIKVNASRAAVQVVIPGYEKHIEICDFPFEIDVNRVKVNVKVSKRELKVHIVGRTE